MRVVVVSAVALFACGCGRVGFDSDRSGDAERVSDARGDANPASDASGDATTDGEAGTDAPALTWTLVQSTGASSGVISVNPFAAGDLVIVAAETTTGATITIADNAPSGSSPYAEIAAAASTESSVTVRLWFAPANADATTVSVEESVGGVVVWEVAGLGAFALDSAAGLDNQPAATDVLGPTVPTSQAGDFIVAVVRAEAAIEGTVSGNPFVDDQGVNGDGFGHLAMVGAPPGNYQPEWTQSAAAAYSVSVAAFR